MTPLTYELRLAWVKCMAENPFMGLAWREARDKFGVLGIGAGERDNKVFRPVLMFGCMTRYAEIALINISVN